MKKLLLATTMLVTAGHYAAADVSVSGDGRMGVVNAYDKDTKDNVTTFSNRMRIKFSGSGTTSLAAMNWGRDSVGIESQQLYHSMAVKRLEDHQVREIPKKKSKS